MIALTKNDVCFSTVNNGNNIFNSDGQERDTLSPELARTAFAFKIEKKQSYDAEGRPIPRQYHLVRDDDNAFIPSNSVGEQFTPVQHLDVFDYIVNDIMPKVPGLELEMAGTLEGGGRTVVAAKFGDTFKLPGDKSANELRLFFDNPTNGTGRMTMGFTSIRIVCQNTLLAAREQARNDGWFIKHTKSAPEISRDALASIEKQAVAAIEMKRQCEWLAGIGMDSAAVERCLDAIYPVKHLPEGPGRTHLLNIREEVVRQFESGETAQSFEDKSAWTMFNAFTYRVFNPLTVKKGQDIAAVQFKATMGANAERVRDIFDKVSAAVA